MCGRAGAPEEEQDRHGDARRRSPASTPIAERDQDRRGDRQRSRWRVGPGAPQDRAEVDQAEHGDDDGGGERRLSAGRRAAASGRQRRERDARRGEDAGRRRLGAGVEVDDRAREAARHRIAAGERGRDVGGAEPDQFLVGVDALPPLGREGLRDRDRSRRSRSADQRGRPRGRARARRRTRAASGAAGRAGSRRRRATPSSSRPSRPDGKGRTSDGGDRPGLGRDVGGARRMPEAQPGSGFRPLRTQNRNAVARRADHERSASWRRRRCLASERQRARAASRPPP